MAGKKEWNVSEERDEQTLEDAGSRGPRGIKQQARKRTTLLVVFAAILVVVILGGGARLFVSRKIREAPIVIPDVESNLIQQYDRRLFWSMKPNVTQVELVTELGESPVTFYVSTNEQGLRNPPIGDKGSRFRILAIGDSTTFGLGVNDDETWPAQLQAILNEDRSDIEVINAGVNGYSSFQGLRYIETRGLRLAPDLVIVTFGYNDSAKWVSDIELASSWSRPVALLLRAGLEALGVVEERPERLRLSPGEFLDTLIRIRETCEREGAELLYLIWPSRGELSDLGPNVQSYRSLIVEAARRTDAACLDLRDAFRDAEGTLFVDDVHAHRTGCRVVAEAVAGELKGAF